MHYFRQPEIPTAVYVAESPTENRIYAFLRTKLFFRHEAFVCEFVVLHSHFDASSLPAAVFFVRATGVLMQAFARDCRSQNITHIIVPRAKCDMSPGGALFNLGTNPNVWASFYAEWCESLCEKGYYFLHLETDFSTRVIRVDPAHLPDFHDWFFDFLDPATTGNLMRLRAHHYSLWRIAGRKLRSHEIDTLIRWQKENNQYALRFNAHGEPTSVFGRELHFRGILDDDRPLLDQMQDESVDNRTVWFTRERTKLSDSDWTAIERWRRGENPGNVILDPRFGLVPVSIDPLVPNEPTNILKKSLVYHGSSGGDDIDALLLAWQTEPRDRFSVDVELKLSPQELDMIKKWQQGVYSEGYPDKSLEFDAATGIPIRMFGQDLTVLPEDVRRLQVVAYRNLVAMPPHLRRLEIRNWWLHSAVVGETEEAKNVPEPPPTQVEKQNEPSPQSPLGGGLFGLGLNEEEAEDAAALAAQLEEDQALDNQ